MRWHTVNYRDRGGSDRRGNLVNVGFWLHDIPRPLVLCRLFGHRPVVDGFGPRNNDPQLHAARWVVCDRCAVRPDPQGSLDHHAWNVGDRYTGRWSGPAFVPTTGGALVQVAGRDPALPGAWPDRAAATIGGQLVIGRSHSVGVEVKVGNAGSEQDLACSVKLGPLGALYLHTERFGAGLVRRLNGVGYQSKVTGWAIHNGHLWWSIWRDRDGGWSSKAPWTQRIRSGSVRINPLDILFGPARYSYEDVGEPVEATVRMPHGDDHQVTLQLQRQTLGRKRWPWKRRGWTVDWTCEPGIPTKPGNRGRIMGSGVDVPDAAVSSGTWPVVAAAKIAVRMTTDRRRYDREPELARIPAGWATDPHGRTA